jgi:hypothetical protein
MLAMKGLGGFYTKINGRTGGLYFSFSGTEKSEQVILSVIRNSYEYPFEITEYFIV